MPVRIIFRGLILFDLPDPNDANGRLVAQLINKETIPNRPKVQQPKPKDHSAPRGPHEHDHGGRIQVATDHGNGDVLIPAGLQDGENIDITVPGNTNKPLRVARSFRDHVPSLREVMTNASIDSVRRAAREELKPNEKLIRNTVTVDRGILRVRNLVTWDHGAFPLSGKRGQQGGEDERGIQPASHVALKFVGSNWQGHIASEFVVDIEDADSVTVASNKPNGFNKKANATGIVNHRVPYETVEILITNYEVQEHTAVPWGLDFQWLFEAVGYAPADLADDFDAFHTLGTTFDAATYTNDTGMLLDVGRDPTRRTTGRPFPYVVVPEGVERLTPLNARSVKPLTSTDEEDRPICIGGIK